MFKLGIIGAGWIAHKMAATLAQTEDYCVRAIASRSIEKAKVFAQKWGISKAYGSYEELVNDDSIDLVYVATPHSHHLDHALLAIRSNKPVLVEKAFTANTKEAEKLLVDEAPIIPIIFNQTVSFSHKHLKKLSVNGLGNVVFTDAKLKNYKDYLTEE